MGINPHSNGSSMNFQLSSAPYHSMNGGMVNSSNNNLANLPMGGVQSICCLVDNGVKCSRASGNASYSKRIEKQVLQRKLRLSVDPRSPHTYICEHHKQIIQTVRTSGKRKRKDDDLIGDDDLSMNDFPNDSNDFRSNDPNNSTKLNSMYDIDFHTLQVNTLRRYKRHYRFASKPGLNKNQLAEEVNKHFRSISINEKEVINTFMYMLRYHGNKLDNKNANND